MRGACVWGAQVSDAMKAEVSEEAKREARRMAKERLQVRGPPPRPQLLHSVCRMRRRLSVRTTAGIWSNQQYT